MSSPSPLGAIRQATCVSKKLLTYIVGQNNLIGNMSNRSGQEEQILIAIDQLRRRKTRTDLEGICNFMQRRFTIDPRQTVMVLNMMLTAENAKVMAVSCKGGRGTSYRRAKPGVASPMKVGADVSEEVATAMISAALCEMILLEPDYLETGVPLDAFEKFMFDKDNLRFSEPMVLALVRAELDKGNLCQRPESGNLLLSRPAASGSQPGRSPDCVKVELEEDMSKETQMEAKKESIKDEKKELKKETKKKEVKKKEPIEDWEEEEEEEESPNANGGMLIRPEESAEREGGRLRRKRAARVVFDPSDIQPPPKKRKPVAKDGVNGTSSPGAPPNPGKSLPQEKAFGKHGRTPSQEKLTPGAGKRSMQFKTILAKPSSDHRASGQDRSGSQNTFVKLEKGFTRIQPAIAVKTLKEGAIKPADKPAKCGDKSSCSDKAPAKTASDDKGRISSRVKTYGLEKTRDHKVLSNPECFPSKVVEVYSASSSKGAVGEKEAAKLLMKEKAIVQTQSIIQARLANMEHAPKEGKTPSPQKTDKSPVKLVRGDKLAFALAEVCHVCHRPADDAAALLTCTDCANTAHVRCTERRDALRREEPWRCVHCKTCCVCAETDEYAAMVVCCRCEDAYHLSCHPTQEEEEGSANWLCAKCLILPRDRQPITETMDEAESCASSGGSTPSAARSVSAAGSASRCPAPREHEPDPEVPDAALWSVDDVAEYFTGRGYHMQGKALRANEVDGSSLLLMRRGDVISGLNLPLGPALKAFRQVRRLQLRQNDDHMLWA